MATKKRLTIAVNQDVTGFGSAAVLTTAHHRIARHYSSVLLGGPPVSDALLDLVMHMFTEEEADLVRHLKPLRPKSARRLSRLMHRSEEEVRGLADHLALNKKVILASGSPRKYTIIPIIPGTFEMALMTADLSVTNAWHQTFARLFERLWETGWVKDYGLNTHPPVRYLPVGGAGAPLSSAWPSDRLEEIVDRYDTFAVGHCQCRLAMRLTDKGCDRPLEACVSMGPMAKPLIQRGMMRAVDAREVIAIKRDAEERGCVSWMMNATGDPRGDSSCSCCGCCCHALRMVTEFSVPRVISRPHFLPQRDDTLCNACGKCAKACPMGAWFNADRNILFNVDRCIGCGLCVVACPTKALSLAPAHDAPAPETSYLALLFKMTPGYLANSARVFARRLFL